MGPILYISISVGLTSPNASQPIKQIDFQAPSHATGLVQIQLNTLIIRPPPHATGLVHTLLKYVDNLSFRHATGLTQTLLNMWIISLLCNNRLVQTLLNI